MKYIFLVFLLFYSIPNTSFAYSARGHELVCEIAYELMSDRSQRFIDKLGQASSLDDKYRSFGQSCNWADEARRTTHRETDEYHYMNVPKAEKINFERDCADYDCVTQAVRRYRNYLANPAKSQNQRMEALMFLGHFVADLHQPLHVANTEDRGGNGISVSLKAKNQQHAKKMNLHAVWDNTLVSHAGLHKRNTQKVLLDRIRTQNYKNWTVSEIEDWATESFVLARSSAYLLPDGAEIVEGTELSDAYLDRGAAVTIDRIMKASVRLAFLVDQILAR